MSVWIESGFVKVNGIVSIDLELIQTQSDLIYQLWMLGCAPVNSQHIAEVIEVVSAYRGWDIGLCD